MNPLGPTRVPPLTGADSPVVVRPNGDRVRFLSEDVRLVQRGDEYLIEADDLPEPLLIPREEIVAAAAQAANLIAARLHDARRAIRVLDDAILGTDEEALGATIANTLIDGRGDH